MTFEIKLKDPNSYLDFGFNWSDPANPWLGPTETITTSSWSVSGPDSALVIGASGVVDGCTTVWLDLGTVGSDYLVTNRIVTSAGRADERTFTLKIRQR